MTSEQEQYTPDSFAAHLTGSEATPDERQRVISEMSRLLDVGLTPTQVFDIYAVEVCGLKATKWAEHRDVAVEAIYHSKSAGTEKMLEAEEI